MLLSWGLTLLHGISRTPCSRPLGTRTTLLGFLPLQRMRLGSPRLATGCPVFTGLPAQAPHDLRRENLPMVPSIGYGIAPRLSQPFSDFFLPKPSHHFQMGNAPGVLPYRDLFLSRSPNGSPPLVYPLDVLPAGCAVSVLGWRLPQARVPLPRMARNHVFYRLQGLTPHENRSASKGHV